MKSPLSKSKIKEDPFSFLVLIVILLLLFTVIFSFLKLSPSLPLTRYGRDLIPSVPFLPLSDTSSTVQEARMFFKDRGLAPELTSRKADLLSSPSVIRSDIQWFVAKDDDRYTIEYFTDQDVFAVTINGKPYDTVKASAEQWFLDQGFSADDLCKLPVQFFASYLTQKEMEDVSVFFPTGCPLP